MESVTGGGVIDDNCVAQRPSYQRHVFDEHTLKESAVLPEKSVVNDFLRPAVQNIDQRVCILA